MQQSRDINDFIVRCDEIINLGNKAIQSFSMPSGSRSLSHFRSAALSFINMTFGQTHSYYTQFLAKTRNEKAASAQSGVGIMEAIRGEFQGGWLTSARILISAEVFSDYIEMAAYLLRESYKDAADEIEAVCERVGMLALII